MTEKGRQQPTGKAKDSSGDAYLNKLIRKEKQEKRTRKLWWAMGFLGIAILCLGLLMVRRTGDSAEAGRDIYRHIHLSETRPDLIRSILDSGKIVILSIGEQNDPADTLRDMSDYYSSFRKRYFPDKNLE